MLNFSRWLWACRRRSALKIWFFRREALDSFLANDWPGTLVRSETPVSPGLTPSTNTLGRSKLTILSCCSTALRESVCVCVRESERVSVWERECVCVCVCVREREIERERERVCMCKRERERDRECVCVQERERERVIARERENQKSVAIPPFWKIFSQPGDTKVTL